MSKYRITHTKEGYKIYRKVGFLWIVVDSRGCIFSLFFFLTDDYDEAEKKVRTFIANGPFKKQHWYFGD